MAKIEIHVTSGRSEGARCPFCHGDLTGTVVTCELCGTKLHRACRGDLGRCPTLGCTGLVLPPRTAADERRRANLEEHAATRRDDPRPGPAVRRSIAEAIAWSSFLGNALGFAAVVGLVLAMVWVSLLPISTPAKRTKNGRIPGPIPYAVAALPFVVGSILGFRHGSRLRTRLAVLDATLDHGRPVSAILRTHYVRHGRHGTWLGTLEFETGFVQFRESDAVLFARTLIRDEEQTVRVFRGRDALAVELPRGFTFLVESHELLREAPPAGSRRRPRRGRRGRARF